VDVDGDEDESQEFKKRIPRQRLKYIILSNKFFIIAPFSTFRILVGLSGDKNSLF